jgi:glycerol-3-phosphate acyltransferase PlsY
MAITLRRLLIAIAVALYLYFLLPATATLFYELYHLTHFGPIYWGYSGFKAAGYYLGIYEYRLLVCVLAAVTLFIVPALWTRLRKTEGRK